MRRTYRAAIWAAFLTPAFLTLGGAAAFGQAPSIAAGGVLNAASFDKTGQPVAPGSLVSIFGTNLGTGFTTASSVPLSVSLANVGVTFNGVAAPLLGVFGSQINAQVPWELMASLPPGTNGSAQVVVTWNSTPSSPQTVALAPAAPGIFTVNGSGTGQAVACGNSDGQIAAPAGSINGLTTHPAKINDPSTLVILATGLGAVANTVNDGDVPSVITSACNTNPTVMVGNVPASVVFCGLVGRDSTGKNFGFVGVYQLNIIIQPGTPTGNTVPLQVSMNGITTSSSVTIAVSD